MPKKTSRSARALQAQRTSLTGERRTAARPLVDVNNSRLVAEADTDSAIDETASGFDADLEPKTAPVPVPAIPTARAVSATTATRPVNTPRAGSANGSNVIRPASPGRRPVARRTTTTVSRGPAISREEEYAFIRSDLMTVFLLTVLMIIALVVLTFVIGR
jgi:hypothetical protein